MLHKRLMCVLWPAFLAACVLEALVFALIDPQDLHWLGQELSASRETIYTVAFFAFWLIAAAGSALTAQLAKSADEVNR